MEVYSNHIPCEDPVNFLGFEKLAEQGYGKDCLFFYGGHANPKIFEKSDKLKYFFSTEEASWNSDTTHLYENEVEQIFTICPQAIIQGRPKRTLCFFPFNEEYIPEETEKQFDAIYTGSIDKHIADEINILPKFNYRLVGFSGDPRITNRGVSYLEKLKLISQSKIGICHSLTNNHSNEEWSEQCKSRYFECGVSKTIILCKRAGTNVISQFFTEGEDFLYFDNSADLEEKIAEIIKNYDKYKFLSENAYLKTINNYTTRKFIEKYLQ